MKIPDFVEIVFDGLPGKIIVDEPEKLKEGQHIRLRFSKHHWRFHDFLITRRSIGLNNILNVLEMQRVSPKKCQ